MRLIILTACFQLTALQICSAADIFAPAPKAGAIEAIKYPTAAAFLAATRSGEIPEAIEDFTQTQNRLAVGRSVIEILRKEYRVSIPEMRNDIPSTLGLLFSNLTKYELGGGTDQNAVSNFKRLERP